ncbi:uncharacterized [Tachysurus ichikawai]
MISTPLAQTWQNGDATKGRKKPFATPSVKLEDLMLERSHKLLPSATGSRPSRSTAQAPAASFPSRHVDVAYY